MPLTYSWKPQHWRRKYMREFRVLKYTSRGPSACLRPTSRRWFPLCMSEMFIIQKQILSHFWILVSTIADTHINSHINRNLWFLSSMTDVYFHTRHLHLAIRKDIHNLPIHNTLNGMQKLGLWNTAALYGGNIKRDHTQFSRMVQSTREHATCWYIHVYNFSTNI
jgi:hypothetical protein